MDEHDATPTVDLEARAAAQDAADARATRLLKRIGIGAVLMLLAWIAVVVASFAR